MATPRASGRYRELFEIDEAGILGVIGDRVADHTRLGLASAEEPLLSSRSNLSCVRRIRIDRDWAADWAATALCGCHRSRHDAQGRQEDGPNEVSVDPPQDLASTKTIQALLRGTDMESW